jgi:hypothetical protein
MASGKGAGTFNPWALAMFATLRTANPTTVPEETAYSKWLDQTSDREQARSDRVHGAEGVVPRPLWFVLFFAAIVIFVFSLFFADRSEHPVVQGLLIGSVVAVIAASLLLLHFLDNPYRPAVGGLQPTAMERTLSTLDEARRVVGQTGPLPCNVVGEPV